MLLRPIFVCSTMLGLVACMPMTSITGGGGDDPGDTSESRRHGRECGR